MREKAYRSRGIIEAGEEREMRGIDALEKAGAKSQLTNREGE